MTSTSLVLSFIIGALVAWLLSLPAQRAAEREMERERCQAECDLRATLLERESTLHFLRLRVKHWFVEFNEAFGDAFSGDPARRAQGMKRLEYLGNTAPEERT